MNLRQPHDDSRLRVAAYKGFNYDGIDYGVYVITGGTFMNKGDGGFINWQFHGSYARNGEGGKIVMFKNVA